QDEALRPRRAVDRQHVDVARTKGDTLQHSVPGLEALLRLVHRDAFEQRAARGGGERAEVEQAADLARLPVHVELVAAFGSRRHHDLRLVAWAGADLRESLVAGRERESPAQALLTAEHDRAGTAIGRDAVLHGRLGAETAGDPRAGAAGE